MLQMPLAELEVGMGSHSQTVVAVAVLEEAVILVEEL